VGVILWAINTYVPMQPAILKILNVVTIIVVVLWVLNAFGVMGHLTGMRIGR
jgi:hypothetical protein